MTKKNMEEYIPEKTRMSTTRERRHRNPSHRHQTVITVISKHRYQTVITVIMGPISTVTKR